ncbi:MAG TPA: hypothetical protein DDW52_27725 [Planctomycetaceae bacterium]|nr:hypothetical protein [Planctomycetaceae bacterium]
MTELNRWLTVKQTAAQLGICAYSVRNMCERGVLQAYRPTGPTGHWRVLKASVQEHIRKGLAHTAPAEVFEEPQDDFDDIDETFALIDEIKKL